MMKWSTFKGAWYEKSFKDDWLNFRIHVGQIEMYANTKTVFLGWKFITDEKPLQRKHPDA
jgi:hypothetical protein